MFLVLYVFRLVNSWCNTVHKKCGLSLFSCAWVHTFNTVQFTCRKAFVISIKVAINCFTEPARFFVLLNPPQNTWLGKRSWTLKKTGCSLYLSILSRIQIYLSDTLTKRYGFTQECFITCHSQSVRVFTVCTFLSFFRQIITLSNTLFLFWWLI